MDGISLTGRVKLMHFHMQPMSTLEVYSLVYPSFLDYGGSIDNYFWSDAGAPQGFGPFQSLFECMEHYKKLAMGWQEPESAPIIRIDFKRKIRVD